MPTVLNIIGLSLEIFGGLLLFLKPNILNYGLRIAKEELNGKDRASIAMDGMTKVDYRKYVLFDALAKMGLLLLVIGFTCQLIAAITDYCCYL